MDPTELLIGGEAQYFFDDAVIETLVNLKRTIHRPERHPGNPMIKSDRPWEQITYTACNGAQFWRDDGTGRFHCLYTNFKFDRDRYTRQGGSIHSPDVAVMSTLYASSDDGRVWQKPALGIHHEDSNDTNTVLGSAATGGVYNLALLDDPLAGSPEQRYKALYTYVSPSGLAGHPPVRAATSGDGIHWTTEDRPLSFGKAGSGLGDVLILSCDPDSRTYLCFTRHGNMGFAPRDVPEIQLPALGTPRFDVRLGVENRRARRRIFLAESHDFVHWTDPRLVLAPTPELDNVDVGFYGLAPFRVGGQWLGFLNVLHMVDNTMNVELAHSRDGRNWRRVAPTHPWLECGPAGSWEQFMVTVSSPPIEVGEQTFVYYGGARNHHDWWFSGTRENRDNPRLWDHAPEVADMGAVGYSLGLAKIRRGGFVSLGANRAREGFLVTQPLLSRGDRLEINACCGPDGYVVAEVTDVMHNVLPGRVRTECDRFLGDSVAHQVTWRGDPSIPMPDATGMREGIAYRRIRFFIRDAELYSFRLAGNCRASREQ